MDRWLEQRQWKGISFRFNSLLLAIFLLLPSLVLGMPANPQPFTELQGDGTQVELRARGASYTHKVCEQGTTICSNETVTNF